MDFETSFKKVDEVISRLSSGDIPLEEAIELYKTGADELARCKKLLEGAEKAVKQAAEGKDE